MANSNTDIFRERLADCIREMADHGIISNAEASTIIDDFDYTIGSVMSIEEKAVTPQQLDWHMHGDVSDQEEDMEGTMFDRLEAWSWR